jgi:hypothetical protein
MVLHSFKNLKFNKWQAPDQVTLCKVHFPNIADIIIRLLVYDLEHLIYLMCYREYIKKQLGAQYGVSQNYVQDFCSL